MFCSDNNEYNNHRQRQVPFAVQIHVDVKTYMYNVDNPPFLMRVLVSQCDQLPVSLIAQLVEHCTSIAEVMVSNPLQA